MNVRDYEPEDFDGVLALQDDSHSEVDVDVPDGYFEDLKSIGSEYQQSGAFLVVENAVQIVGMAGLKRISTGCGEIKRMRVHPEFQRRGIARLIVSELESRARKLGLRMLVLSTLEVQTKPQNLYETCGFSSSGCTRVDSYRVVRYEKVL